VGLLGGCGLLAGVRDLLGLWDLWQERVVMILVFKDGRLLLMVALLGIGLLLLVLGLGVLLPVLVLGGIILRL
jgi:hypothetical protein